MLLAWGVLAKASSSSSERAPSDSSSAFWLVKNWCAEPTRIRSTWASRRLRSPDNRADHVTRAHRHVALRETPFKTKADQPHGEGEETNRHGNNDALCVLSPSRLVMIPANRQGYASSRARRLQLPERRLQRCRRRVHRRHGCRARRVPPFSTYMLSCHLIVSVFYSK